MNNSCVCFTCKDAKMALLKGKHSLLRYLGIIAAIFASLQALTWIGMYISGIICFYINCGIHQPANRFGKAFHNIYLSTKQAKHYPHTVTPIFFHVLLWFFLALTAIWLFASVSLIVDYRKWTNAKRLRRLSKRWILITLIVCALDLLLFVLFVLDFNMLKTGHIGASVRSADAADYEDIDIRPHEPHNPFAHTYEDDSSEDALIETTTVLSGTPAGVLASEPPGVSSEGPALSFEERLLRIEKTLGQKNADVDRRIEGLLARAKLIRETELGTYYNPYVRLQAVKLMEELLNLEKMYEADGDAEHEKTTESEARKIILEHKITTEETVDSQTADVKEKPVNDQPQMDEDYDNLNAGPGKILKEIRNLKNNYADFKPEIESSVRRKFDRRFWDLKETTTDIVVGNLRRRGNSGRNSDYYDDMWASTFQDDDYGIILQNDGPGTGWRKISRMDTGSTSGSDVMLAPSAVLMTLAIRGYLLWVMNLTAALMLMYLYITRPRRPSLITRIQA